MMPPLWGSRGGAKIMVDQGRARDVNEAAAIGSSTGRQPSLQSASNNAPGSSQSSSLAT
jgi:hypothetical protein